MANETIYGCVDWSDGKVTFSQDTCEYLACIIWTGVHAGQVAVTIETDYCDDTYYGCVDWSNDGKFQVSIPTFCCEIGEGDISSCPCSFFDVGGDMGWCVQPESIFVTVAGVSMCDGQYEGVGPAIYDWDGWPDYNGDYTLNWVNGCIYETVITTPGTWKHSRSDNDSYDEMIGKSAKLSVNVGLGYAEFSVVYDEEEWHTIDGLVCTRTDAVAIFMTTHLPGGSNSIDQNCNFSGGARTILDTQDCTEEAFVCSPPPTGNPQSCHSGGTVRVTGLGSGFVCELQ